MPFFDLPIEKLKNYQGINPRPHDFDQYWEAAIEEMKRTEPNVELVPSAFQTDFAECFDLYFTGVKGARIHAKYLRPRITRQNPAILQFHGYQCNCGDWQSKLGYVAAGFCVAAMDCRGQGGSSEDVGGVKGGTFKGQIIRGLDDCAENLLFRHIFLDTAMLASIVMSFPEVDERRVGVTGASQGGALTLACAALEPRIKLAAAIFPFLCDYKRVWQLDLKASAYEEIHDYFRWFDPRHEREDEIFSKLGYIDIQNFTGRIKGKVLMATGLMDATCPPSTQFAAYNKINSEKDVIIYPDFGHESLPDINDIVFNYMMELLD